MAQTITSIICDSCSVYFPAESRYIRIVYQSDEADLIHYADHIIPNEEDLAACSLGCASKLLSKCMEEKFRPPKIEEKSHEH